MNSRQVVFKTVAIHFVAVVMLSFSLGSVRGGGRQKQLREPMVSQTSPRLLLRQAKASCPGFLRAFRSALRKHDRNALYLMSAETLEQNCLVENGKDIRKEFFASDGTLYIHLEIVTPGRHGHFVSKVAPVEIDKDTGVIRSGAEMNPCGWPLAFEYREHAGWLLTHFGQPCEGC